MQDKVNISNVYAIETIYINKTSSDSWRQQSTTNTMQITPIIGHLLDTWPVDCCCRDYVCYSYLQFIQKYPNLWYIMRPTLICCTVCCTDQENVIWLIQSRLTFTKLTTEPCYGSSAAPGTGVGTALLASQNEIHLTDNLTHWSPVRNVSTADMPQYVQNVPVQKRRRNWSIKLLRTMDATFYSLQRLQ